ncbi:hypothetical protein GCM10028794_09670 [Silanimonas algicola]
MGHYDDGYKLKSMNGGSPHVAVEMRRQNGESHHQYRRGQGEANKGQQRSCPPAPEQADGKPHLAARWAGEELANREQLGELRFVKPAATFDEFLLEVSQVSDWPSE